MFTEKIYRASVSSIPAGALTNPPTAYQIKPPLEAQTHGLSHTERHVAKTIHYQREDLGHTFNNTAQFPQIFQAFCSQTGQQVGLNRTILFYATLQGRGIAESSRESSRGSILKCFKVEFLLATPGNQFHSPVVH